MDKQDWKEEALRLGATLFAIDTTDYCGKVYDRCIYAISSKKRMVGAYSTKYGGKVFTHNPSVFCMKGRTFKEVSI